MAVKKYYEGQELNYIDIAKDVGVSQPTAKKWLSVLRASGIVYFLQPYFRNTIKRLIKTPKMYFLDTGLAAYLAGWTTPEALATGAAGDDVKKVKVFKIKIFKVKTFNVNVKIFKAKRYFKGGSLPLSESQRFALSLATPTAGGACANAHLAPATPRLKPMYPKTRILKPLR